MSALHEEREKVPPDKQDLHRAIDSLREELEAVDWYQQRASACSDDGLRRILLHHRKDEIEHAMMLVEWLRRHDGEFAHYADVFLYSKDDIAEVEENAEAAASSGGVPAGSLTIGSIGAPEQGGDSK